MDFMMNVLEMETIIPQPLFNQIQVEHSIMAFVIQNNVRPMI